MKHMKTVAAIMCILFLLSGLPILGADAIHEKYDRSLEKLLSAKVIINEQIDYFKDKFDWVRISRGEAAAILCNMMGEPNLSQPEEPVFTDMAASHWAVTSVNRMYKKGIVKGYGNNIFQTDKMVTEAEFITMLVRVLGYEDMEVEQQSYPEKYLQIAKQIGLTVTDHPELPITYGDLFVVVLDAMHSKINGYDGYLWDLRGDQSPYRNFVKETTLFQGLDENNILIMDNGVQLLWEFSEDSARFIGKNVTLWYNERNKDENGNFVIVDIIETPLEIPEENIEQ